MKQGSLFPKTVSTISFSQDEILRDIIDLHIPEGIEVDCTYSKGNFYKNIEQPKHKFDLEPQLPGVIQACATKLPFGSKEITSLMFDPPFIASWHVESKDYLMKSRFSSIKGIANLHKMYEKSIEEFSRIIKSQGILVVKCQDTVYAGRQYYNHCLIYNMALKHKFTPVDMFVLMSKTRFIGGGTQRTARKYHSYFWVFKKLRCKRSKVKL